jgi:hypothetical protein
MSVIRQLAGRMSAPLRLALLALGILLVIVFVAAGGTVITAGACPSAEEAIASQPAGELRGVPKRYVDVYFAAAERFKLGSRGPAILAAVHKVETNFGTSTLPGVKSGTNSAGAMGPMQFLGPTWSAYGVDGDHDGEVDVYDNVDAIYGAANYLHASGAPGSWYDAIFAYNHADWYVQEVEGWAKKFGRARTTEVTSTTTSAASSSAKVTGVSKAYSDFAVLVSAGTGLSLRVVGGWALAEGGPDDNPLNIGPGRHFGSIEAGAKATIALLSTPLYKGIIASANGSDQQQLRGIAASSWCPGCGGYLGLLQRTYESVQAHGDPGSSIEQPTEGCAPEEGGGASGPASLDKAVRVTEPRTYKTLPANLTYGPQKVDARIYDDAVWVLKTYDLKVTAGAEAGHASHGDGAALDMVPAGDNSSQAEWDRTAGRLAKDIGWIPSCGSSGVPPACPLKPAFRFVGYDGYPSHGSPRTCGGGCPMHIHVSWLNATGGVSALAPQPAEWIMVFPAPEAGS